MKFHEISRREISDFDFSTPIFGSTAPKHPHRGHLNTKRAEESAPPMGWPPGLVPAEPPLPPARSPKKAGGVAAVGRYQL